MKLLKKIFFWILIACALFWVAYIFLRYYNPEFDIIEIYNTYSTYLIVLFVSIMLVYIFALSNKKIARAGVSLIVAVNFLRLISFFSSDIIGLNQNELYLLVWVLILGFLTSYIKNRIRYPLIVIIGLAFIVTLLSSVVPLYEQEPDIQGFVDTQRIALLIQSQDSQEMIQSTEAQIIIKSDDKEKIMNLEDIKKSEEFDIKEKESMLSFSAKPWLKDTYAHILFPDGNIITLSPQTAINIAKEKILPPLKTKNIFYNIELIQWKIAIYNHDSKSWTFLSTGYLSGIIIQETDKVQYLIDNYTNKKKEFLINQIGWDIMLNKNFDQFIWRYINILYSIYPDQYGRNVLNYNEFHKLLPYEEQRQYKETKQINTKILQKTNEWFQSTKIKWRRDGLQTTIDNRTNKSKN